MSASITPGWYPDPSDRSQQRFWDGTQWVGKALPVGETPPDMPEPLDKPGTEIGAVTGTTVKTDVADPVDGSSAGQHTHHRPGFEHTHDPRESADENASDGKKGMPHSRSPLYPSDPSDPHNPNRPGPVLIPKRKGAVAPPNSVEIKSMGMIVGWISKADVDRLFDGRVLASRGSRFVARLLDIIFVGILAGIVNSYFLYQWFQEMQPLVDQVLAGTKYSDLDIPDNVYTLTTTMMLLTLGMWFAYEVPANRDTGQTLGKKILGIQVASLVAKPAGWGRLTFRWIYMALPLACFPWGLILWIFDSVWCTSDSPFKQCLHDKTPGTIVIEKNKSTTTH